MRQNDPLRAPVEQIDALLRRPDAATVAVRYAIAVIVADVKSSRGRYGPNALGRLAIALRRSRPALYREAAVVECWPPQLFREHIERQDGAPSWSHWILLATVPETARRETLLERVSRERLAVRTLRGLAAAAGKRPRARGPTLAKVLREHLRHARRWIAQSEQLRAALARTPLRNIDPALIEEAIDVHGELLVQCTQLLQMLEAARRPVLRVVR
jgi:hypothetical protein